MLKRSYARAYILMNSLGYVLFIINFFMNKKYALREGLIYAALVLWGVSFIILLIHLRCPDCGKMTVKPQWSKSGTQECSNCGKVFEYDK